MTPLARALFTPRRIALVGASADPSRLTARAQIHLRRHGFDGTILPINPRATEILGEPAYPSLDDAPGPIDHAFILLGADRVEEAIAACARRRVPVATVLADGFAETGAAGAARQARLLAAARAGGVRLMGPNCIGMINVTARTALSVNAVLAMEPPLPVGRTAVISHSGSLIGAILSRGAARGLGYSVLAATGNEADLGAADLLALLAEDEATDVIALFLETIRDPGGLRAAAGRAFAAGKAVIAYKLGRSAAGAAMAVSHTGAIAGADAAVDALLAASGIARLDSFEGLIEAAPLFARARPLPSPRRAVAVVTTTGGGAALVVDRLGLDGIEAAEVRDMTLAGTEPDRIAAALEQAAADPRADAVVAVIGSSAQFRPEDSVAGVLRAAARLADKPLAAFLAPDAPESARRLAAAGIACFRTPEAAADALRARLAWRAPRPIAEAGEVSAARTALAAAAGPVLDEAEARAVLGALGVPIGTTVLVADAEQARRIVPRLGFPVALKAVSAALPHKTEAGAVALGLADAEALVAALSAMAARLAAIPLRGFLVAPMETGVGEALLGFRRDPQAGPVVVLGAGGVFAELMPPPAIAPAPLTRAEAAALVAAAPLAHLRGARGRARGDLAALAEAALAISRLAALDEVAEAEINPLLVRPEGGGVVALDALVVRRAASASEEGA
ncbi:acetate--CoA ligase family protein [Elioraea sp.]|jgi:acyl-CoA synthetase (NDP forming)|uniref:acetate--CoA ligase family protein n=1 Tax=Elioraea sp. TaxID=2185103 RepID=UPI0021DEB360|nr:acetate--CoA ligase family protein [Elioraea sp.]GIX10980.1 MAG: 6-carboxyhexanoate--CoA ligase [Elioraea sp.]